MAPKILSHAPVGVSVIEWSRTRHTFFVDDKGSIKVRCFPFLKLHPFWITPYFVFLHP